MLRIPRRGVNFQPALGGQFWTGADKAGKVFQRDPDEVDRGLQAHARIQDQLAALVEEAGLSPLSPFSRLSPYKRFCNFDLAWMAGEVVFLAEVKSLRDQNETAQLRLGLGQVLDFSFRLRSEGWSVQPVMAVEQEPSDPAWMKICAANDVRLVWPESMSALFRLPER